MILRLNFIRSSELRRRDSIVMTNFSLHRIGLTLDDALIINDPA